MLQHEAKQKSNLTHQPAAAVKETVDVSQIVSTSSKSPKEKTTTIRVQNSLRNEINALINLGAAPTVQELLSQLVSERVNAFNSEDRQRYETLLSILNQKDAMRKH